MSASSFEYELVFSTEQDSAGQQSTGQQSTGPWYAEIRPCPEPVAVFQALEQQPHCLFLDSAAAMERLGRYSFVMADPVQWHTVPLDQAEPLAGLRQILATGASPTLAGLPPFQGGIAGLWSYDLNRSYEHIAPPAYRDLEVPAVAVGVYDTVVAWDHAQDRCWLISQGFPETDLAARRERAQARIRQFHRWLHLPPRTALAQTHRSPDSLTLQQLGPQYEVEGETGLYSNFHRDEFLKAIATGIEYIRAGDIFQVNLAHRLLREATCASPEVYLKLRSHNPAPFAGYLDLGDTQVISASPERLVQVRERWVESRPIKGTTQRTRFPEADLPAALSLQQSEKDRAENVMIVDLLRNDLSKVCQADSIHVTQLCEVESYQYVQHLVSAIQGRLNDDADAVDLIEAIFPGGSITGAPKIRAMEIIAELEPTPRGAYCGSLGYLGFDGSCDFNILIRTITAQRGWWSFPVGGGIVFQSTPEKELIETWHKAHGLLRSLAAVR